MFLDFNNAVLLIPEAFRWIESDDRGHEKEFLTALIQAQQQTEAYKYTRNKHVQVCMETETTSHYIYIMTERFERCLNRFHLEDAFIQSDLQ